MAIGKTKILKGDGTEGELDGKGGEFGDDFVLIVKSEHGGGNSSVTNTVSEDEIIDRIDALTLRLKTTLNGQKASTSSVAR
jgi:hypothetical protein